MRLAVLATMVGVFAACAGDPAPANPVQPHVGAFGATYGLFGESLDGAALAVTTATGVAGFARLDYYAAPGTATFHFAACIRVNCGAPGGTTTYTAPPLRLASYVGRVMTFASARGAPDAVTVSAFGVQAGIPFDLDAQGRGAHVFRVYGTLYPFR
jgi:hypothetical protein